MNDLFESLRDYGVSQKDALCYALWLERQSPKLPIRLEHWLPTPLPLGYLGKDNRLVRLPFLDLNHKEQVFGIMVGDMCLDIRLLGRNCGGNMLQMGFISVNSELTCLHNKMYPPHKNVVTRILASESVYARDPFVPTLNQMQQAYMCKDAFDTTIDLLAMHEMCCGIKWGEKCFICRDDEIGGEMQEYHQAVDFKRGVVEEWSSTVKYECFVRAALPVNDYDPPYPVDDNGCFDWTVWRKECAPYLDEDPQAVRSKMFNIFMG